MSGIPPSAPTGVPAPRPEDPGGGSGADKRILAIAVVVMVCLVLVGVVSGALFNQSACVSIDPDPVTAGAAGDADDLDAVLAAAFPDVDDVTRQAMANALDSLSELLGPISGVAEVTGADGLAPTDGGVAALGPVTSALDAQGSDVLARADVGDGQVIGSGEHLYAVAVANELTGQVDAVTPLDGRLEGLTCVDTALINTPLAFVLDADGGEILLLRIDEDGGGAELELRDPVEGRVWGPRLDIGLAQPGVQGERLTGRLGPELAVTGRRTVVGDEHPVLTAVDRQAGETVWTVDRDDLDGLVSSDVPEVVEVLAVGHELALIGLSSARAPDEPGERTAAEAPTRLVAVDTVDGSLLWNASLAPGDDIGDTGIRDAVTWIVIAESGGTVRFERRDAGGVLTQASGTTGDGGRVAILDDGRAVVANAEAVTVASVGDVSSFGSDLVGRDAVAHDGSVTLLFDGPAGGSITVTFGG